MNCWNSLSHSENSRLHQTASGSFALMRADVTHNHHITAGSRARGLKSKGNNLPCLKWERLICRSAAGDGSTPSTSLSSQEVLMRAACQERGEGVSGGAGDLRDLYSPSVPLSHCQWSLCSAEADQGPQTAARVPLSRLIPLSRSPKAAKMSLSALINTAELPNPSHHPPSSQMCQSGT